ncbi:MAG: CHAT domain-containing protein [Cyanobacteria bacterium P01_G01_bin.54]
MSIIWHGFVAIAFGCALGTLPLLPVWAQSITAAPDGTGTIITIDGNRYNIQGGTQAGTNLFHSFQEFGLSPGEIANFLSNPGINNILGRVVGGNASIIDGLIQANPNLYLMNPAGIIFGARASLNVGGDFTATTADQIGFEGGGFNAVGANHYAALVGTPNQFVFASEQPGAVLNFGDLSHAKNVSLVGGTVVNAGTVVSSSGNVTIAAVPGERLVRLSEPGMLLSLEVAPEAVAAGIRPVDLPALLTGSGAITGELSRQDIEGDVVIAGEVQGQQVDLYATGKVTPTDTALIQGDTRVVRFSETGENPGQALFIEHRSDNPEALLYGAEAGTVSQMIEREENGIEKISNQLAIISESVGELESVAIVAEGNAGNFWLGSEWIRSENIGDYQAQLQQWGAALTESADILLYSCFTALGETGEALVNSIANLTGADVAASVNATGSANYGGDWTLENSTGTIEAGNPFMVETLANWEGKLATRTVTNFADSGTLTLRDALTNGSGGFGGLPAAGDTIIFASAATVTLTTGEIAWAIDNLTIDGNGGVVDGNNASRVFNIAANNTTIQNITIQNGTTALSGGGIYHLNAGLTLKNSTISGNSAGLEGGGIASNNIIVTDSTISGNSSDLDGGGIWTVLGTGDLTVTRSTISGNDARSSGGGIFAGNNITVDNSTISENSARYDGGGIRANVSGGTVTVDQSVISRNSAGVVGGGIASADVTVTDSLISGNTAANYGGGIYVEDGSVTQSNTLFTGNVADRLGNDVCIQTSGLITCSSYSTALSCEVVGECEQEIAALAEEDILITWDSSTSLLDTGVEDVEADLTNDYDIFANADPLTLREIQNSLKTISQQTRDKPALLYLTFFPATLAEHPPAETLLADASSDFGDVRLSQRSRSGNPTDQLQAILVTPQGEPIIRSVMGVNRAQVNGAVQALRRRLTNLSDRYLRPAQQLYDWLIQPVEAELQAQGIQNLSIIADEGLRSLPIAALHDGEQFLIEQYSLGVLPSISLVDTRYQSLNQPRVLAMGASRFASQADLPAVPTELELVTLGQAQAPYLDEAFTHANLKRQAGDRNFDILHLATHAVFQAGAPDQAYVQLWGEETLKLESFRDLKLHEEPAVELLILSACQTALGDADAELGFAGASLQAGVKSVLASLWSVSDLGTMRLMSEFYGQLADPAVTIKAEALRQAQLSLLRGEATLEDGFLGALPLPPELAQSQETDLTHPFYWSAFMLVGSPW